MIVEHVRRFLLLHGIAPCRIAAACSGGIDSTALLLALADLRAGGFEIVAAHVNHHLRGSESDADEAFVREIAATLGIRVEVADGTLDQEALRRSGIEGAARDVRHARLQEIRSRIGAACIATAHQLNDQAETVLMRLMTGSGIAGLRAIHPVRDDGIIRPLLEATRAEIERFLHDRGVVARLDRSNTDPRFLRNRIRRELARHGEAAAVNIAMVAAQAQQLWPLVEREIDAAEQRFARISENETLFSGWPDDRWLRQALLHRHIRRLASASRDISSRDLERLASEIDSIRRVSVTKDLELVAIGGGLVLRRTKQPAASFEIVIHPGDSVDIPSLGATIQVVPVSGATRLARKPGPVEQSSAVHRQAFQLPPGAIPEFVVRSRRSGDRFQPLGMPNDKKLKDFLIDRKIEAGLRDRIPLLAWNGEIVWVGGVEVSERFKVTSQAANLYEAILQHAADDENRNGLHR